MIQKCQCVSYYVNCCTNAAFNKTYINEDEIQRLTPGGGARFYPDNDSQPMRLHIINIDQASTRLLSNPWFASDYGGDVAVSRDNKGRLVSHGSVYRVLLASDEPFTPPAQLSGGTVDIQGDRQSILGSIWRLVASTVIRESGF